MIIHHILNIFSAYNSYPLTTQGKIKDTLEINWTETSGESVVTAFATTGNKRWKFAKISIALYECVKDGETEWFLKVCRTVTMPTSTHQQQTG